MNNIYRGNTQQYKFQFTMPNPLWTGEPPEITVVAAGTGDYDHIGFPLDISSKGVITEDWTLTFTSDEEYDIVGASVGHVGEGNIAVDATPNNPDLNVPYFTLLKGGWVAKTTWQAGDTLTFSTIAKTIPEDITDLIITLTFIVDGADSYTVQVSSTAGDNAADDPTNGLMVLTLHSGKSALLVDDEYLYDFERRAVSATNSPDEDLVYTIEKGKVKILTPAKPAA